MRKVLIFKISEYHLIEEQYKTLPKNKDIQKTVKKFMSDLMEIYRAKAIRPASCYFYIPVDGIEMKISILAFYNSIIISFIKDGIEYRLVNNEMNIKDLSKLVKPMHIFLYACNFDENLLYTRKPKQVK